MKRLIATALAAFVTDGVLTATPGMRLFGTSLGRLPVLGSGGTLMVDRIAVSERTLPQDQPASRVESNLRMRRTYNSHLTQFSLGLVASTHLVAADLLGRLDVAHLPLNSSDHPVMLVLLALVVVFTIYQFTRMSRAGSDMRYKWLANSNPDEYRRQIRDRFGPAAVPQRAGNDKTVGRNIVVTARESQPHAYRQ